MPAFAALLALALAASPKPRPPSALDKCTAIPTQEGFQYECADLVARMDDRAVTGDEAVKWVAARLKGAGALVGEGAKTRTEKRVLGAGEVQILVTEAPGKPDAVFIAPLSFKAGTRVLTCNGGTKRCGAVLSGLAALPWRSETPARGAIPKEAGPLSIGGRPVVAPKGCETVTEPRGGRVVCAKTDWVLWVAADEPVTRQLVATNVENMRKLLGQPGWKITEREVPCRLAGAETTCTRILGESSDGTLLAHLATARIGDGFTFASCLSLGDAVGKACALVLEPR